MIEQLLILFSLRTLLSILKGENNMTAMVMGMKEIMAKAQEGVLGVAGTQKISSVPIQPKKSEAKAGRNSGAIG